MREMANTYDLADRVVLVTGASGGLGPAVVRAFVRSGAMVEAVARTAGPDAFDELRAELGNVAPRLNTQVADVLDEDAVRALIERVVGERGRLDIALNLVGGFAAGQAIADLPY